MSKILQISNGTVEGCSQSEEAKNHAFAEEYRKRLVDYSFGMILREGNWDEELMEAAEFYAKEDVDLHRLS